MTPRHRPPSPNSDKAISESEQHIRFLRLERAEGRIDPRVAHELIATFDHLIGALADAKAYAVMAEGKSAARFLKG